MEIPEAVLSWEVVPSQALRAFGGDVVEVILWGYEGREEQSYNQGTNRELSRGMKTLKQKEVLKL